VTVQAAGGVVWRQATDGVEVLLVHRPRYGDWSLPKGKLDPGETEAEAAVREVEEETGLRCELGPEVATSSYVDGKGRPKTARYWAMACGDGTFHPSDEVDEVAWLSLDDARDRISYDRDAAILDAFEQVILG
jgi:8-oxo-dGTP pyrophosphatase MutT (NUDIX family)